MTTEITSDIIDSFRQDLDNHPIYEAVRTIPDLQCFMEHHIYSVWDFMSLVKYLQSKLAPANAPWTPVGDGSVRRFINELVLEEESDETGVPGEYSSHFELYQRAMTEVGCDITPSSSFVASVRETGINQALKLDCIPAPSRTFTATTFGFIQNDQPHQVAAALALGREHIIPDMFRAILSKTAISETQAPIFHYYLKRHVELDGDFHAPLSLRLLNGLCAGDELKIQESIKAARQAVAARVALWDGVLEAINSAEKLRGAC